MIDLIKAAAIELHRAQADFATSADSFADRRLEDARRRWNELGERWGGELRQERDARIQKGAADVLAAIDEMAVATFMLTERR